MHVPSASAGICLRVIFNHVVKQNLGKRLALQLQTYDNVQSICLHAGTALDVVDFLRGLGIEVTPLDLIPGIMAFIVLLYALSRAPLPSEKEIAW